MTVCTGWGAGPAHIIQHHAATANESADRRVHGYSTFHSNEDAATCHSRVPGNTRDYGAYFRLGELSGIQFTPNSKQLVSGQAPKQKFS